MVKGTPRPAKLTEKQLDRIREDADRASNQALDRLAPATPAPQAKTPPAG